MKDGVLLDEVETIAEEEVVVEEQGDDTTI